MLLQYLSFDWSAPPEVLDGLAGSLERTMTVEELRRALTAVTDALLRDAGRIPSVARHTKPLVDQLRRYLND